MTVQQSQTCRSPARSLVTGSQDSFLSMSMRLSQQPTQTAAPFRAHQFHPQPDDISTDGPNDAQHSPLSNIGSPSSDNSGDVMCPPLGNLIGNVANGVNGALHSQQFRRFARTPRPRFGLSDYPSGQPVFPTCQQHGGHAAAAPRTH